MVNHKISEIAQKLWDVDVNRFVPNQDYELDLQKEAIRDEFKSEDLCSNPLFKFVDEDKLNSLPTYTKFIALLDNYKLETRNQEVLSRDELMEESDFLDACLETEVMKLTLDFLINEGKLSDNKEEFKSLLSDIWFTFYSRSANSSIRDSSAFEHVFVGEIKQGGILGCHNWIQYYLLEKRNKTNYYGYFPEDCEYQNGEMCMLGMQFYQAGQIKTLGGFLIGVSPEFELAFYTILFLCCGKKTKVNFAGMEIAFNCYKMERDNDVVMATLFASKH